MKILDTRELQERADELDSERDTAAEESVGFEASEEEKEVSERDAITKWNASEDGEELADVETLRDEIGSEWEYGVQLIPTDDFEDYAREFAEDIGAISNDAKWPYNCIDWERAARELMMDYSEVEFRGTSYQYR